MSVAATVPALDAQTALSDRVFQFRAMASEVTVRLPYRTEATEQLFADVANVFAEVESSCSRFDPTSSLMRANAAADCWYRVEPICLEALQAAHLAYQDTNGLFDPRVLRSLEAIGYDRSFACPATPDRTPAMTCDPAMTETRDRRWQPAFDPLCSAVRIGPDPVDLGGIGRGLALRWAAQRLRDRCEYFLIEAAGDCVLGGCGPTGAGWSVSVQDPAGGRLPVAVLSLADAACATTSTRVRRWRAGAREVHDVIDPSTGAPSASGLASVTVAGDDPAACEVASKVLLLLGSEAIADAAADRGLAVWWVDRDGGVGCSAHMEPRVLWRAGRSTGVIR